ncbi:MAG: TRAP transporter large permease subunit, partial [Betaproteobacteria bacterium]
MVSRDPKTAIFWWRWPNERRMAAPRRELRLPEGQRSASRKRGDPMSGGAILVLMGILFLVFGYMGVPVSFALIAGVLVATSFTPISMQSMIGQLFHGIDSEALLAVPFFLLVGE